MSIATVASQQAITSSSGSGTDPSGSLASLSSNLDTFLHLLMTQLQNQDPTSPLDSSQFTSQLVQYSGVEQQIQTNEKLNSLIQMTQSNEIVQSADLFGKSAEVTSDHLSLQQGQATVKFVAPAAETVNVVVTDSSGRQVVTGTIAAAKGTNSWTWNGANSAGNAMPSGSYRVDMLQTDTAGNTSSLPTTIVGTVTGVSSSGTDLTINMGGLSVPFSALVSM